MEHRNLEDDGAMPLKFEKKIISNLDYLLSQTNKCEDRIKMFLDIHGLKFSLTTDYFSGSYGSIISFKVRDSLSLLVLP